MGVGPKASGWDRHSESEQARTAHEDGEQRSDQRSVVPPTIPQWTITLNIPYLA